MCLVCIPFKETTGTPMTSDNLVVFNPRAHSRTVSWLRIFDAHALEYCIVYILLPSDFSMSDVSSSMVNIAIIKVLLSLNMNLRNATAEKARWTH
jgi:hypothetical protein